MGTESTFSDQTDQFHSFLSETREKIPYGYQVINPFQGKLHRAKEQVRIFYNKFYNDCNRRRMIIGSSPAWRGLALTGIPFENPKRISKLTDLSTGGYYVSKGLSDFLELVMEDFGGVEKFYSMFYMIFVCLIGLVRTNNKGNLVNVNYYESFSLACKLSNKEAGTINEALQGLMKRYPIVSITTDNGSEFSLLSELNDIEIYFAYPYSSRERRTYESFNGLLREFLPKGQSFNPLTEEELSQYIAAINGRPRRLHHYKTSKFLFGLAQTA